VLISAASAALTVELRREEQAGRIGTIYDAALYPSSSDVNKERAAFFIGSQAAVFGSVFSQTYRLLNEGGNRQYSSGSRATVG
jgi:hypothetical protein